MLLRLQQGIGRLIRTSKDNGEIHLLLNPEEAKLENRFVNILPTHLQK